MQPFESKHEFVKCYNRKFSKTNIKYKINIISYTHNMEFILTKILIVSVNIAYILDY